MTEINNRIEKVLKEALWMAYCSGRANNKYIPEEVVSDLMKRCQLFPQPLPLSKNLDGLPSIDRASCLRLANVLGIPEGKVAHIYNECQKDLLKTYYFPQPLDDKELREVSRTIVKNIYGLGERKIPLAEDIHIGRILALLQLKIRQERERIIKWGEEPCPHPTLSYYFSGKPIKRTCKACWQALKGGE